MKKRMTMVVANIETFRIGMMALNVDEGDDDDLAKYDDDATTTMMMMMNIS